MFIENPIIKKILIKTIETIISVKIQLFVAITILCTVLLVKGYLESGDFSVIIVTSITGVIGARSIVKYGFLQRSREIAQGVMEKINEENNTEE